jgi:predicted nucleic acid-binding protein
MDSRLELLSPRALGGSPAADGDAPYLGLIMLALTDVAHTEALEASPEVRLRLRAQTSQLREYFGPFVLNHSRLGSSLLGSEEDRLLLDTVFSTLFPRRTWATGSSHDQRDAMHVAWAIRYAFDGLITGDDDLLRRKVAVRGAYNGFQILSPDDALVVAHRRQARAEIRESRNFLKRGGV